MHTFNFELLNYSIFAHSTYYCQQNYLKLSPYYIKYNCIQHLHQRYFP